MEPSLIGVATDDLALPVKTGLGRAAELGFGAVEIGAATSEVNPRVLSASGRRHLSRHVANQGLRLVALGADPANAARLDGGVIDRRAADIRAVMEMAVEMAAPMVTLRVGTIVDPSSGELRPEAREFLEFTAIEADRVGAVVAVRFGADDPLKVAGFLNRLDCPALRACIDPAEAVLAGRKPPEVIESLARHLGLAHAHDVTLSGLSGVGRETNLGRGDVDFREYLAALAAAGYAGAQIIRRADSRSPLEDLAASKEYLESQFRSAE